MPRRLVLVLLGTLLMTGCGAIMGPPEDGYGDYWYTVPEDPATLTPLDGWEERYDRLVACADSLGAPVVHPDFRSLRFYGVQEIWFQEEVTLTDTLSVRVPWRMVLGFYSRERHAVYLIWPLLLEEAYEIVVPDHEMFHHITNLGHPQGDIYMYSCVDHSPLNDPDSVEALSAPRIY